MIVSSINLVFIALFDYLFLFWHGESNSLKIENTHPSYTKKKKKEIHTPRLIAYTTSLSFLSSSLLSAFFDSLSLSHTPISPKHHKKQSLPNQTKNQERETEKIHRERNLATRCYLPLATK
ncbi:hypothetical protein RIF29_16811 [Crotalaria pallida]|uniref:Uncharacterized protein n=1 Tax=Crotalaria pallida TaxID=3830 RepID=A0AAN9FHB1_CROPI